MTIELWEQGGDKPIRTYTCPVRQLVSRERNIWINEVRHLPGNYYIIVKNAMQSDKTRSKGLRKKVES